jgi:hypothetical protein
MGIVAIGVGVRNAFYKCVVHKLERIAYKIGLMIGNINFTI